MEKKAFQDYYPDDLSCCYGCGRFNEHGLQIKSYWDGEETVCIHQPKTYYTAIPGYVYGGLIASLIDCHSTGTAAAARYKAENRGMDTLPPIRFLTASLHVDYLYHIDDLIQTSEKIPFYYGFGMRLRLNDKENGLGVRGVAGIIYNLHEYPVELFFEVVPVFQLFPETALKLDAAVGGRYYFN